MINDYLPVFLQALVVLVIAVGALTLSIVLGKVGRRNRTKDSPYECGMLPISASSQPRFSVKFYLVAMLFILFDIEVVFMYPWAVVYKQYLAETGSLTILWSMLLFVVILTVGYVYALKKGVLNWNKEKY